MIWWSRTGPANAVFIYNTVEGTHRRWDFTFDSLHFCEGFER